MADKRHAIMAAVVTRMQEILSASGYYSNLGQNIYEWRPKLVTEGGASYVPFEQTELPAIDIRDPLDTVVTIEQGGTEEHSLSVEFEIAHEAAATGQTMRKQIADVRKAIGVDVSWGGLASDTSREMTTETVHLQGDRKFFRTLVRTKITYLTSEYAES